MEIQPDDADRFLRLVSPCPITGCWWWLGATGGGQHVTYGIFKYDGRNVGAHRFAFAIRHGRWPTPEGRHLCGNGLCANPQHVTEGTSAANAADREAHGRTARGARIGIARLNESSVRDLRTRYAAGESPEKLAQEYGVRRLAVYCAVTRRTWRHVQ